jgi:hypothetical protein
MRVIENSTNCYAFISYLLELLDQPLTLVAGSDDHDVADELGRLLPSGSSQDAERRA